jgi:hypothetical protein
VTPQVFSGVQFSHSDVADQVAALDYLIRIACKHRERVPQQIVAMRRELAESAACATACADLRFDAPAALESTHWGPGIIGTAKAAEMLGKTEAGVRYLCSHHHLVAMRPEGRWLIAVASVEDYKLRNRKVVCDVKTHR